MLPKGSFLFCSVSIERGLFWNCHPWGAFIAIEQCFLFTTGVGNDLKGKPTHLPIKCKAEQQQAINFICSDWYLLIKNVIYRSVTAFENHLGTYLSHRSDKRKLGWFFNIEQANSYCDRFEIRRFLLTRMAIELSGTVLNCWVECFLRFRCWKICSCHTCMVACAKFVYYYISC